MQNQDYIVILAWITLKKNYTIKKIISVNNKKKKKITRSYTTCEIFFKTNHMVHD